MGLPTYAMSHQTFPEMYEQWLAAPLFRPSAELTLDEVNLAPGDSILDIACGTGVVARVAKERLGEDGSITGVDISPEMLAVARRVAPDIDWREGNALALPLRDGEQFDVVVCQQGLQFFPEKSAAAAQMRRALAPGGRLAVSTWRPDDEVPFFRNLRLVAERHLGAIVDQRHSFGDSAPVEALLYAAGFRNVRSRTISSVIRFVDGAPLLRLNTMALVGMSAAGKRMADEERKRVVEAIIGESAPVLASHANGAGIAFELSASLTTAKG
jgi:ubiquinone/menaquinone biosynthesis C-methylase UbiE